MGNVAIFLVLAMKVSMHICRIKKNVLKRAVVLISLRYMLLMLVAVCLFSPNIFALKERRKQESRTTTTQIRERSLFTREGAGRIIGGSYEFQMVK